MSRSLRNLQTAACAVLLAVLVAGTSSAGVLARFFPGNDHTLHARADCKTATVASGDGCASLATKCGVSAADFTKYNPKLDCSTLSPGQWVCCGSGTLPSRQTDGLLRIPMVRVTQLMWWTARHVRGFRQRTTLQPRRSIPGTLRRGVSIRWTGCGGLQPGMRLCGSTGTPPLPKTNSCESLPSSIINFH
ncbi:hypothetical protein BDV93DRAFT_528549 [Ceratobasidium sp. AG-I]|nr:hypothetical protein BDV93DRAFT_528549 [Ceratobasidium sp. AG-I]